MVPESLMFVRRGSEGGAMNAIVWADTGDETVTVLAGTSVSV